MVYLINSPVLTNFGSYVYKHVGIGDVKSTLNTKPFTSAIGHETTALFLTHLLGQNIPCNRIAIRQTGEDILIVFKLKIRGVANKEYSFEEMEQAGYEFGILTKTL
ncbi:MAG: YddF family protein [Bacteroidales bacterium]|nr:YddF family protein [Bacteroidales bacterium]